MNQEITLNLDIFAEQFLNIEESLQDIFASRVPLVQDIGRHALLKQGKRLRPLIFVLSCRLCNYGGKDIYALSTIFECIHAASLLHDDVLDNADIRRNRPSANQIWGNQAAVLGGDFLFSKALSLALGAGRIEFLKTLTSSTSKMTEGQILELEHTDNWKLTREQYMEIVRGKTAALISSACECGAIISGVASREREALAGFGLNAGTAFQLIDDLLDYTSSEEVVGKPVGKDLLEGKITLPLIYTLEGFEAGEKNRMVEHFMNGQADAEDRKKLIRAVRTGGAISRVRKEAQGFVDEATACLRLFPDSPTKKHLLQLNGYITKRKF
ncbi:MAG TPA: polyprenyl synthetase family protein [Deltaproteobacteria bacterium]|nr:polyprenyl synthetase family protein [Deltaproteobacteria bacterium]